MTLAIAEGGGLGQSYPLTPTTSLSFCQAFSLGNAKEKADAHTGDDLKSIGNSAQ